MGDVALKKLKEEAMYEIYGRYRHLTNTDAGVQALEAYEYAIESGVSTDDAEEIASEILRRTGHKIDKACRVSIRKAVTLA